MASGSLESRVMAYLNSAEGQKKCNGAVMSSGEAIAAASAAGDMLVQCLHSAVRGSGLSANALSVVDNISASAPVQTGDDTFSISVEFADFPSPSLAPGYGGISDLVNLFNNGMTARAQVWGTWHGEHVGSRTTIPGAHFVESGISAFMGSYSGPCRIISCTASGLGK